VALWRGADRGTPYNTEAADMPQKPYFPSPLKYPDRVVMHVANASRLRHLGIYDARRKRARSSSVLLDAGAAVIILLLVVIPLAIAITR
jgi:hypothetical protein